MQYNKLKKKPFYHCMIKRLFFFTLLTAVLMAACKDNDSFSASSSLRLTFSADTLRIDTVFSESPSATYSFWVFNNSGDGLRISSVRLERGNQTGFRVNADGQYLNPVATDIEIRKGDSIRVFVELTARVNNSPDPRPIEDRLVFSLQSGVEQSVALLAFSWDARRMNSLVVRHDTVIESANPIIFTGDSIVVERGATLTLRNTTLYFHDGTGMLVRGRLIADSCVLRGDRLDHMFDYLPYDRVSGQWPGIRIAANAEGCQLTDCEIRNAFSGIVCDSSSVELTRCTIHNSRGHGLHATDSRVVLRDCMLTNTLMDCLALHGCQAEVTGCTLAQFYPFTAPRGAALRFAQTSHPTKLDFTNVLVTGYEDDVLMGEERKDSMMDYRFRNCILRTPEVTTDTIGFRDIIWETPKDSVQGKQHFLTVDEENLIYNFQLDSISPALQRGIGCILPQTKQ